MEFQKASCFLLSTCMFIPIQEGLGKKTHLPGFSGTRTLMSTSRRSPTSARSATNRSRPKFMLPPEMTATKRLPAPWRLFRIMWAFRPARERAPDGSGTDRVSTWGFLAAKFFCAGL